MGLGSIVGTGLFVSLGIAAGVVGDGILLALPLAALLALCNGLSSAQLAAAHPVSGGTYEYGYRVLNPVLGFSAGWMFLLAKGASAATAALGLAGYLLLVGGFEASRTLRVALAAGAVLLLTVLLLGGIRRTNRANILIVGITLAVLAWFLVMGLPEALRSLAEGAGGGSEPFDPFGSSPGALLHATALLFVAYTGYGRIATLGEEVRDPESTIPRAIWITLGVVALLYTAVAVVALGTLGASDFAELTRETAAPLQAAAALLEAPGLAFFVGVAAVTAMLGVLLNLILGLSRVALAMGRRSDLPPGLARVHSDSGTPRVATLTVGSVIFLLVLAGDVSLTWTFSAFTVLIYYGITNLAALRLPPEQRRYPRWIPATGLLGCLLLAFQVPVLVWATGTGILVAGLLARSLLRRGTAAR
ncbi:MAG: APC family permease [Gemmatimonadales bacterium]|nr:MAG: APC family permease [Gemmatimonadales bacterium]